MFDSSNRVRGLPRQWPNWPYYKNFKMLQILGFWYNNEFLSIKNTKKLLKYNILKYKISILGQNSTLDQEIRIHLLHWYHSSQFLYKSFFSHFYGSRFFNFNLSILNSETIEFYKRIFYELTYLSVTPWSKWVCFIPFLNNNSTLIKYSTDSIKYFSKTRNIPRIFNLCYYWRVRTW